MARSSNEPVSAGAPDRHDVDIAEVLEVARVAILHRLDDPVPLTLKERHTFGTALHELREVLSPNEQREYQRLIDAHS